MHKTLVLGACLTLAGCASLGHPPGTLPQPVTLSEVNRVLEGELATVHFADGRAPERWYVEIRPDTTYLLGDADFFLRQERRTVSTAEVAQIEIDDSLSPGQGAVRGAGYGMLPGAAVAGIGAVGGLTCTTGENDYSCLGPALLILGGMAAVTVGVPIGAGTGATITSRRYPVTVYQAPITRYPDAALALLERERSAGTVASR